MLIAFSLLCCGGCAVFNRNNTPALNLVEQYMVPKDQTARVLSYPVVVPIGMVAGTMDMLVLHPLSVAGDAWDDTNEFLWSKLDWDNQYVTTTVVNAPLVAFEPVVFTLDFLARSSFDISRRGGDVRTIKGNDTGLEKERTPVPKADGKRPSPVL
jgi:hypothetical protein